MFKWQVSIQWERPRHDAVKAVQRNLWLDSQTWMSRDWKQGAYISIGRQKPDVGFEDRKLSYSRRVRASRSLQLDQRTVGSFTWGLRGSWRLKTPKHEEGTGRSHRNLSWVDYSNNTKQICSNRNYKKQVAVLVTRVSSFRPLKTKL